MCSKKFEVIDKELRDEVISSVSVYRYLKAGNSCNGEGLASTPPGRKEFVKASQEAN